MRRDVDLDVGRPTVQASNIEYNGGLLSWTRGNGEFIVVFVSEKPVDEFPIRDIFTAEMGMGYEGVGRAVYKGTGNSVQLDLPRGSYWVNAFEFNGENSLERYHIERNEVKINVGVYFIAGAINALKGLVNGLIDYIEPVTFEISGAINALKGEVDGDVTWEPTIHEVEGDIQGLKGQVSGEVVALTPMSIINDFDGINITAIDVEGVPVTVISGAFPLTPGNVMVVGTRFAGLNKEIEITHGLILTDQRIRVFESDGNIECQDALGSATVFPSVTIFPFDPSIPYSQIEIYGENDICD